MEHLYMQAACNRNTHLDTLVGEQISVVVRLGSRELLLQADGDGNYTLDVLINNNPIALAGGNLHQAGGHRLNVGQRVTYLGKTTVWDNDRWVNLLRAGDTGTVEQVVKPTTRWGALVRMDRSGNIYFLYHDDLEQCSGEEGGDPKGRVVSS